MNGNNPTWLSGRQFVTLLAGALIATVVTVFWQPLLEEIRSGGPVDAGKSDVRDEAAQTSRYVAIERDFATADGESWFVVLRHTTALPTPTAPAADELRIYDETIHGLSLAFKFQPRQAQRVIPFGPDKGKPQPQELVFQLRAIRDLTGDDEPEVIGAYYIVGMEPLLPRPVVLQRQRGGNAYEAIPPTSGPNLAPRVTREEGGLFASLQSETYREPANLADKDLDPTLVGNTLPVTPVEEYAIVGSDPAIFLSAYIVKAAAHASIPHLEVQAQALLQIPGAGGVFSFTECNQLPDDRFQAERFPPEFPQQIREHWYRQQAAFAPRRLCPEELFRDRGRPPPKIDLPINLPFGIRE